MISSTWHPLLLLRQLLGGFKALWMHIPRARLLLLTGIISGYRGPDDAVSPTLRSWAARKGKEEVELAQARAKIRETRKGLLTTEDSAADAVASGSLPGGGAPKPNPKKKGRGKGLEPPPQQ